MFRRHVLINCDTHTESKWLISGDSNLIASFTFPNRLTNKNTYLSFKTISAKLKISGYTKSYTLSKSLHFVFIPAEWTTNFYKRPTTLKYGYAPVL